MDTSSIPRNTVIAIVLITIWKIYFAATLQLHPDEAYYWMWSRHLDFSYFDHPPLIAYLIRLTTLFSQQELWVRFGGILTALIASALAWALSLQMFGDRRIASASVIGLNVMPLIMSGSVLITPDVPVFLFTALSIYWFWQIVETRKARYWYLVGIAFGLSMLSKYTAVLLAPSFFLFMVFSDERRWFKTIHPYASFLLGCAFFVPVVYWNNMHQWASFLYQMRHGLHSEHKSLVKNLLVYIGGQMLVAGPLFWLPGIHASVRSLFQKDKRMLFLSLTTLPVLVFFAFSSIERAAAANWPGIAYFSFSILAARYLFSGQEMKRRLFRAAVVFNVLLSLIASFHARFSVLPLEKISKDWAEADATRWFYGWKELAEELEKDRSIKFAMTETNQIGPEISYYTMERIFVCIDYKRTGPNQYNYWAFPDELRDKNGVDVYPRDAEVPPYNEYFVSAGNTSSFTLRRNGLPIRTLNIIYGSGYKYPPTPDL